MIVPTAPAPEGRRIVEHAGFVPGGVATGAHIFLDPFAAVRDYEVPGERGSMLTVSANGSAAAVA